MSHSSIGGTNYFLLFKDDCTSYRTVYFIKHKNDTFSKFIEYHKFVENQTGNKLRKVRSDRSKEFDNGQFKQFKQFRSISKKKEFIHEYSAPYTAEQNGRIKRENRSIVEDTRTMLLAANLQPGLWAEAVNTSIYTLNRKPRELDKELPYELWSGKTVTLNHLCKFGIEVYVHVLKQFRSKFQSKSKNDNDGLR